MRLILQSIKDYILLCASYVELQFVINVLINRSFILIGIVNRATYYRNEI